MVNTDEDVQFYIGGTFPSYSTSTGVQGVVWLCKTKPSTCFGSAPKQAIIGFTRG